MKQRLKVIVSVFFVIILLTLNIAFATENQNVMSNSIAEDSSEEDALVTHESNTDICKMENYTEISNPVNGDLYIMSNSVDVSSEFVEGNAFIMGNTVKISGNIYGDAFIMANHVEISGKIDGAYIMANTVDITETAEIERDVKVGADTFNLKGIIYRNLVVASTNININENPTGINVFGKLSYNGNLNVNEDQVVGEIVEVDVPKVEINKKALLVSTITDFIVTSITALVIIALIVYISDNKYENKDTKISNYVKDIAWGFLYLCMIPIISAILIATLIGIPIGIFGLILYFLGLYISIPVTSIEISKLILKENNAKIKITFVAFLVFVGFKIIGLVPSIGGMIRFLAILYGLKTVVKTVFNKASKKEEPKEAEPIVEIEK